ncbi:MAG: ChaN family lipoprotein, partial [Candidatus Krumholzibacteria bacterium]|nr:ChaN family lipoprotein [Candidatus Krumholzibacteria bacterium]
WMKGVLNEEEFLKAIDYRSEWGFNWESYRRFFSAARKPFVPVFGIDYEPRDQLRFIRRRDRMIARKIASLRSFFPGHTILVVIGESHIASGHLPADVRKLIGGQLKETTIVQNADEIYWKLLRKGRQDAEAVQVSAGRYCVFTASPMIKYQSYRRVIDLWTEGADCDIHTPSMVEMGDNILNFIVGGRGFLEVTVGEDWREPVESVVPEVHYGSTYKSIAARLRALGMSQKGVLAAAENLRRSGMSYIPAVNSLQIQRFDLICAAREAARFILYAMRDEIGPERKIRRTMEDRFYAFVFEEALCTFGARLVNPVIKCGGPGELFDVMGGNGSVNAALHGMTLAETRKTAALLRYHIAREKSGGSMLTEKMKRIHRLGIRKRLWIIKALGWTLGEALYNG